MSLMYNLSPASMEDMYLRWQESPEKVPGDWHAFFRGFELGREVPEKKVPVGLDIEAALKQSAVQSLIYRYRDIGHLLSCLDPLSPCHSDHPLLSLEAFGLSAADLDTTFHTRRYLRPVATLREILEVMRETYCRSLGVEFMYIQEPGERQWLIDRMEPVRNRPRLDPEEKLAILEKLQETAGFEAYLSSKFIGKTRFSLEGGEVLIPALVELLAQGARQGVEEVVIGMPHRGRLDVMAAVMGKPLENIFGEFRDNMEYGAVGDGDVKYHAGHSCDLTFAGTEIHVSLAANPSHLEAIDPVVEGKTRAKQDETGEEGMKRVLPLLLHGDAAFAGQGVVAETLNLSQLEGFGTGGTIHIVVNNQIGFTTLPIDARSSCYATDAAKIIMAPVFHVHGEDPEAAIQAVRLAVEYRQTFHRDVVIEVVGYRRYGHNEGDEPSFTQPLMYGKIKERPTAAEVYAARLKDEEGLEVDLPGMMQEYLRRFEEAFRREPQQVDTGFSGPWTGVERDYTSAEVSTKVEREELCLLAEKANFLPAGFAFHPKVVALLQKRLEAVRRGEGIDWANAEMLAFATLLNEGVPVRLSGQDVRRGTFSQRHAILFDAFDGRTHLPLAPVATGRAAFRIYDSMLSEFAVLGFEYGYSLATPDGLTLWEAQYGDFVNGAQVIVDQFIASGETKWQRVSGLVLLLPHGYEGQGAEHSSARLERFLQLCAGNNLQVTFPSTPAQYFHLLRRQVKQPFRKPLIVLTPKGLLREPRAVSSLADFTDGEFREILSTGTDPRGIRTVLLCTGKIFYSLQERQEADRRDDVAIVRIEQLYPLKAGLLKEELSRYPQLEDLRWVQEEPANGGAWSFIRPLIKEIVGRDPAYVGRREDASPAVGSYRLHREEQEKIISEAFFPGVAAK